MSLSRELSKFVHKPFVTRDAVPAFSFLVCKTVKLPTALSTKR